MLLLVFSLGGATGLEFSPSPGPSVRLSLLRTVVMESGFPWERYCRGPSYPCNSLLLLLLGLLFPPAFRSFSSIFLFCIALFCFCFSSISLLCWSSLCCLMLADGILLLSIFATTPLSEGNSWGSQAR